MLTDADAYLTASHEIPADGLVSLTGQVQKACSAIPTDEAANYKTVKKAILLRYDVTKESY